MSTMSNRSRRDITRDIWKIEVAFTPELTLLPLTVAHGPEEVPVWDWTRGYDPAFFADEVLEDPVLSEHYRGIRPYGPEVEEAFIRRVVEPLRREGWYFIEAKPTPPLLYPRLVRKHAGPWSAKPKFPLYPHVLGLARSAREGPTSPRFERAVVKVAQTIGLLDPYGDKDDLFQWHAFAIGVEEYIRFLREAPPVEYLEEYLAKRIEALGIEKVRLFDRESLGFLKEPAPIKWAWNTLLALDHLANVRAEGLEGVGVQMMVLVLPDIAENASWIDWNEGVVPSYAPSDAWVFLEIGKLFLQRKDARLCPNPHCGVVFLPKRADQRTCGSERCKKWARRNLGAIRSRSK